jgi:hypothetical protein
MDSPYTWTCPGCGATVVVPSYCRRDGQPLDARRLGQVARALCGCWVASLPENSCLRLLEAIMAGARTRDPRGRGALGTGS